MSLLSPKPTCCTLLCCAHLDPVRLRARLGAVRIPAGRRAGIDVRVAGSGNVGAANVLRTSGAPLGVAVMALDITKGVASVWTAYAAAGTVDAMAAAGAGAIVGHIYPVWLRFHGGKGVAVAAGVFSVLAPIAAAAAAAVFFAIVWLTRLVSLGSVAATVTLPSIALLSGAPPQVRHCCGRCRRADPVSPSREHGAPASWDRAPHG